MRKAKRVQRTLSNAEHVRLRELRRQIDAEKCTIIAEAKPNKGARDAGMRRTR
jgi:hypothetical protein